MSGEEGKVEKYTTTYALVEKFSANFEHEFSMASIESNVNSSVFEHVWIVDSGSTRHMNGLYGAFQIITELGPRHFV